MALGAAGGLSWTTAFDVRKVWIDLVVFAVLAGLHSLANFGSPGLGTGDAEREQAFGFTKELLVGGLTTVGVLLPLSLTAFGTLQSKNVPTAPLENIFLADAWFVLSLIIGIGTLWTAGYRASSENVLNLRDVRIGPGLQVFALGIGVVRLLMAAYQLI